MKTHIKFMIVSSFTFVSIANAQPYGPYNQQYTMNQNYGVSNWMTAFGPGINTAAVTLIGGLVNVMSRPDPVQYTQPQQQPIYVGNRPQTVATSNEPVVRQSSDPKCVIIERPNPNRTPTYEKYCQ